MEKARFIAMLEYYAQVIPMEHSMVGIVVGDYRVRRRQDRPLQDEPKVGMFLVRYLMEIWPEFFTDRLHDEKNELGFYDIKDWTYEEVQAKLDLTDEQMALLGVCAQWFRVPDFPGQIMMYNDIDRQFSCRNSLEKLGWPFY